MKNRIYLIDLYDLYGNLLTEKQQQYFEDYYFSNLTLAEISENLNISRNAVHKQIKESEEKLEYYENTLQIYERNKQIKEVMKPLDQEFRLKIENLL